MPRGSVYPGSTVPQIVVEQPEEQGPPPLWPTRRHKRLACIGLVVGAITASILTVCIGATIWARIIRIQIIEVEIFHIFGDQNEKFSSKGV
ncbi:hypothetical protein L3Y34_014106 [Caenorhabditis briggsae]|uniref:Uncharacterized protein n=1 Tax=Caenorhabditis briggsae TaxID=6238 RepID=A0AAE9IXL9_CAEBR|nr:hypothetical protein L3Y34_014106 [Caenorhabditis briggsae]